MTDLTPKQQAILAFIRRHLAEHGRPPTIRGIGEAFGIVNPNGVLCHLKRLEAKGHIRRDAGRACGIRLLERTP